MKLSLTIIAVMAFSICYSQTCPSSFQPKNQFCVRVQYAGGQPAFLPTSIKNLGPGAGTGAVYNFLDLVPGQSPTANPYNMYFGTPSSSCNTTGYMGSAGNYLITFDNGVQLNCSYDGNGTVLPVEYSSIRIIKDDGAILEWATQVEVNNDFFVIERSNDGKYFEEIGRVEGSGNSNKRNTYSFWDPKPLPGISFYQLVQYDYDGSSSKSEILSFNYLDNIDQVLYNRNSQEIVINNQFNNTDFMIYNIEGKVLLNGKLAEGSNTINIEQLPNGILVASLLGRSAQSYKLLKY